jgi:hypothetical protein
LFLELMLVWIALTNGIFGEGRALYRAVVDADLGRVSQFRA